MWAKSVLLAILALVAVASATEERCGTAEPTEEQIAESRNLMSSHIEPSFRLSNASTSDMVIQTVFHVIAVDDTVAGGYITSDQVEEQLEVINTDFAPYGFSFDLLDTHYYINANWAESSDWFTIRPNTRQGGYDTLNIWIQPSLGQGTIGFCTYPQPPPHGDFLTQLDGCSVITASLPGGSHPRFNGGRTATHEIGHWLNLFHTFHGEGCSEPGDEVDDTPTHDGPSVGCPVGRNSCPELPGLDPIHNYMDYADDHCSDEFTPGQVERMRAAWLEWRTA